MNIGGLPQIVPAAGVTAANTGLAVSTLYYVYAYMNAGAMALELSTTTHATHTNGVEIKNGDSSRTLAGMIYTTATGQFADDYTNRYCLNWFNRRDIIGASTTTIGSTASTASFAELNSAGRVNFLSWADEGVDAAVVGSVQNSSAGNTLHTTSPGVDGPGGAQVGATTYAASISVTAYGRYVYNVTEGQHYASAWGKVSQGTGTWNYGVQLKIRG